MSREKFRAFLFIIVTLAFLAPALPTAAEEPATPGAALIEVGAARTDISPDHSVIMGGYGIYLVTTSLCRWSDGVHDPLYATALYLRKNNSDVLMLNFDLLGLVAPDVQAIQRTVSKATGVPENRIIVAAIHTHQGPDTVGLWGTVLPPVSGRDESYMRSLGKKAAEAARKAMDGRAPAHVFYAVGAQSELHRNIRDDQDPHAPTDHTLTVLKFTGTDGKTIATLTNWGCHPTTENEVNRKISADWVGAFYREMQSKSEGVAVFFNASIGAAIQPDPKWRDRVFASEEASQGFRWADALGKTLADQVAGMLDNMEEAPIDDLAVFNKSFTVPMKNGTYRLAKTLGVIDMAVPKMNGPYPINITAVRMGPLRIASLPGELSPQLGMEIRRAVGGKAQLLVGLSQDFLGYIIDQAQYDDDRYSYEKMLCFSPDLGPGLVKAYQDLSPFLQPPAKY